MESSSCSRKSTRSRQYLSGYRDNRPYKPRVKKNCDVDDSCPTSTDASFNEMVTPEKLMETKEEDTIIVQLRRELAKVQHELLTSNQKVSSLQECNLMLQQCLCKSHIELATANETLKRVEEEKASQIPSSRVSFLQTGTEYEDQKKLIVDLQNRLAKAEHQIIEGEGLRKKLHNTILDLKGSIRVFCRVRPCLLDDGAGTEAKAVSYPTSTESLGRGIDLMQKGKKHSFTFDKVLLHDASQEDVFVEISQLIQSALDGYKVCIFAYGQTGSGKTYTMIGRPGNSEHKGLIPRSLELIFQTSQSLQNQGWHFKMQVSMLEIYNDNIQDLLLTNRSVSDASRSVTKLAIKLDKNDKPHVPGLTVADVRNSEEVSFLLGQAAQSRSVGKTLMNQQSSRSHFVFTLRISGFHESYKQQEVEGVLNFIDLAGSERLKKSVPSSSEQLKETQFINSSLSSISDVINSIAKKEDHVPYRNSKLTYLLQPYLGGDSKTLMFVNVSSDPSSVDESLYALQFATRVNACEIGIPRQRRRSNEKKF